MAKDEEIGIAAETAAGLRRRAEEELRLKGGEEPATRTDDETKRLLHELQVHQIELEMQNEELRRSSEELEDALEMYADLYDFAPVGYFTLDRDGVILSANLTGASLLETERSLLIGRRFGLFVTEENHAPFADFLDKVFAGEAEISFETALLKEGNQPLFVQMEAQACAGSRECRIALVDITGRRESEEALRDSQAFARNILETVSEGFVVVDREYQILSANKSYCDFVNAPEAGVVGRHCFDVSHRFDRPCFEMGEECAVRHTFETGSPYVINHTHINTAGMKQKVEIKSFPVKDASGETVSVIETINDITDKTKLEEQLRQSQKMEAIGTLAGGVAHDFNNILMAIMGYGSLAKQKMNHEDPKQVLIDQILSSADRAAHLTKGLLAYSRKQLLDIKPVEINGIVKHVEKLLLHLIGEDIELTTRLAEGDLIVIADSGQIEQVLMNLAVNARDAMPDGGALSITTDGIFPGEDLINRHGLPIAVKFALVTVSDTGHGMDEETREKIFDPFFTTKEVGKGTGLGLAIVYGIVKQHNGAIEVYSERGKGTTFRIYLPLVTAKVAESGAETDKAPAGGTETILLAEDDPIVRALIMTILSDFGYTVIDAVDGEDAIEKFLRHAKEIDLLLLDVIMPKKNGKEVYNAAKAADPAIEALFISGYTADILQRKGIFEENLQLISKPLIPKDLLRKIRGILDKI